MSDFRVHDPFSQVLVPRPGWNFWLVLVKYIFLSLLVLSFLFWARPAAAIFYEIDYSFPTHFPYYNNHLTGMIETRVSGVLLPPDIVSWDLARTASDGAFGNRIVEMVRSSSVSGDQPLTWTPGALVAGDDLVFDWGAGFTSALDFGIFAFLPGCGFVGAGQCGTVAGNGIFYLMQEFQTLGRDPPFPVPAPVVGGAAADLMLLLLARCFLQLCRKNWLQRSKDQTGCCEDKVC